ncbi:hypothetical protein LRP88_10841 [Fusarium phalaenopsidis]
MTTVESLRRNQTAFDYVFVGDGTAGCVVASRLASELPKASILLIEGGESDVGKDNLHDLKLQVNSWGGDHDYCWSSVPQPKDEIPLFTQHSRGKILGGCSNINGCISFRPLEYDIRKSSHTDVDKIAFTGSIQTGKEIMKLASSNLKSVTLETGGKSPLIIFNDADLHAAVAAAYPGIMANAGQNCTTNSRGSFRHQHWDPFAEDTSQGPQVTQAQFDRILSYVQSGKDEGAKLVHGGKAYKNLNGKGFYLEPTIFTHVTPQMRICRDETFGPFVIILPFKSEAEVVKMANDTEFGLAAVFLPAILFEHIASHEKSRMVMEQAVWINNSQTVNPRIPFGGFKQSGIGQEQGEAGIRAYTNYKTVVVDLASEAHSQTSLEPKL